MSYVHELRQHILKGEMDQLPQPPPEDTDAYDEWLRLLFTTVPLRENTVLEMYAIMNNLVIHTKRFCYITAGHYIMISRCSVLLEHHYSDWFKHSLQFLIPYLKRKDVRFTSGTYPKTTTWKLQDEPSNHTITFANGRKFTVSCTTE